MEDSQKFIENKVLDIMIDILKVDSSQEAMYNVLSFGYGAEGMSKICKDLETFFVEQHPFSELRMDSSAQKQDNIHREKNDGAHEVGVKTIVNYMASCKNHMQVQLIAQILHYLATNKFVSAKMVCFLLLAHDNLKPENSTFWIVTFKLIKIIILGVHYKGVREIMKNCLERARLLSSHLKHSELEQANALCDLLQTIFDRRASLLPAYFIVNELLKLYPDYKMWPHWRLSRMLTDFIDECRKAAQLLTIAVRHELKPIVEHSGHSSPSINSWKLDSTTLKFPLKGALPYSDSVQSRQTKLLKHVLRQPASKEMISTMLDLQKKQRYQVLEEHLVELFIETLEECAIFNAKNRKTSQNTEKDSAVCEKSTMSNCQCSHFTSLLVYFVLHQLILFKTLVQGLHDKLKLKPKIREGRDHLMWSLLQFLSGTVGKYPVSDFQPVLRLIELLYPESDPLPIPDFSDPYCSMQLAAMCILILILRRAQSDNLKTPQTVPAAFTIHHDLLQNLVHNPQVPLLTNSCLTSTPDYRISLLFNAFSTNQDVFHRPIHVLNELICGSQKSTVPMPGINCVALGSTTPFSMNFLDSLTIHVKMTILHNISTHISKQMHNKSNIALAPALVENYARLLVYSETESLGTKQFISQVVPAAFKNHSWGILHGMLEMFTYRIHHSPPQFRVQLLSTIHHMSIHLNSVPNMNQLHLCMESSALSLITRLGNNEVMPTLTRVFGADSKANTISSESEELNRVLVLTLARAIHITGFDGTGDSGRWCVDFLKAVMALTQHTWATHTLQCFPPVIADFYKQHGAPRDTQNLKKMVEEEYLKFKSMSNENDIIAHFSLQQHNTPNMFLCLLFKMVFDTTRVPAEAYKVLERLGSRNLMAHVRTLCDFLVVEFSHSSIGQHLSKCVETINAMMWQFNIVSIDRLILCLTLRTQEGSSEAQVCLFIIQLLLLKPSDFRNRVQEFVSENSPEHWTRNNWYEKHLSFHRKFPEKFAPESGMSNQGSMSSQQQTLPIYFTNVCLRFLPVMDIMIHRFLEVTKVHKHLDTILDQLGCLYKFHDRPITYLYNTLHYYESRLRDSPILKRQLVGAVVTSQKDFRPQGWALSSEFTSYLIQNSEDISWNPTHAYYMNLMKRLVHTIQGKSKSTFPDLEWRFNEFANVGAHALHVTCVEIMALPTHPTLVANNILDTLIKGSHEIERSETTEWINAIGMVLAALPEAYWSVVHDRAVALLQISDLLHPTEWTLNPFMLMDVDSGVSRVISSAPQLTLAVIHAFWHHGSFGQVGKIPQLMKERLRPILKTEEQLVVLCQLVSPFLNRFGNEAGKKLFEIPLELYEALATIDREVENMKYQDAICDLCYHIKYMFTGDTIKSDVEPIIRGLRPSLRLRLRFITNFNIDEIKDGSIPSVSNKDTPSTTAPIPTSVANPLLFSKLQTGQVDVAASQSQTSMSVSTT